MIYAFVLFLILFGAPHIIRLRRNKKYKMKALETLSERLIKIQQLLDRGGEDSEAIFEAIGYLGPYHDFYEWEHLPKNIVWHIDCLRDQLNGWLSYLDCGIRPFAGCGTKEGIAMHMEALGKLICANGDSK